jgi:CBS domain containing-hemolysin-like protein
MLLSATALCAAAETAFFSLHIGEIRLMEHRGDAHAKTIAHLRMYPERLLVTILLLNTAGNITIASYATVVATRYFGSIGVGIATGVVTLISLIFAEIFPKSLAITHKRRVSKFLAPIFAVAVPLLSPVTYFILKLQHFAMQYFGGTKKSVISEEEVRVMAELGLEHGSIDRREQEMIERIFQFDDIPVQKVMTKADNIVALDGAAPIKTIAHHFAEVGYSRFPIYEDHVKNYIGYVYVNSVLRALSSDRREQALHTIAVPLTRIDANMKLEQAFLLMIRERSHLYLVHEHNNPSTIIGLVTLEDMLEQIVGAIEDEGDKRDAAQKDW